LVDDASAGATCVTRCCPLAHRSITLRWWCKCVLIDARLNLSKGAAPAITWDIRLPSTDVAVRRLHVLTGCPSHSWYSYFNGALIPSRSDSAGTMAIRSGPIQFAPHVIISTEMRRKWRSGIRYYCPSVKTFALPPAFSTNHMKRGYRFILTLPGAFVSGGPRPPSSWSAHRRERSGQN
jgi:hypothetical protein